MFITDSDTLNRVKAEMAFYLTREGSLITNRDLDLLYCNAITLFESCEKELIDEIAAYNGLSQSVCYLKDGGSYDSFTFFCISAFLAIYSFALFGDLQHFINSAVNILMNQGGFRADAVLPGFKMEYSVDLVTRSFKEKFCNEEA